MRPLEPPDPEVFMSIVHDRPRLARRASLILLLVCTAGVAVADTPAEPSQYAKPGFYLSVAGGGLIKTFKNTGDPVVDAGLDALSNGGYIGGKIGSRVNRWIASETSVDYGVGGFDFSSGGGSIENNPLYVTGGIKLFVTDGRVQPYMGVGIGGAWMFTEISGAGAGLDGKYTTGSFLARVGGGVDFWLNEHVGFGPELWWNITTGDLEYFRSLSIGGDLTFKF